MALDFIHTIDINRPAAEVFAWLADFERNPRWQSGMVDCRWTSTTPGAVGSTYVQHAQFMGRRIDTHFVVTAVDPDRSISIESTQSTFPIQVTRSVEALDPEHTRVTAHIRGQPKGLMNLMSGLVKRSVAKDYRALKALLEAGG
jgi:uncharacterized protein YndB with AHSA1/START domain